jgi:beta-lactamase regulating signal transducer with metallopeptidase domain
MNAWFIQTEELWQLAGWTMLHFLWLGAVAALAGGVLRFAAHRAAPTVRYALSLTTLAILVVLPFAIAAWLSSYSPAILAGRPRTSLEKPNIVAPSQDDSAIYAPRQPIVIDLAQTNVDPLLTGEDPPLGNGLVALTSEVANPSPSPSLLGRGVFDAIVPHLPWLWLLGAPLTFSLLAAGLIGSERLRWTCTPLTSGSAFDACERLRVALRISRRISVAACEGIAQPLLIGIVRPLVLLPAAALAGWTPEELEMVLLHELAHVRRWDNLVNLVQRMIESLLFFHPAVWLVSRQVRRDREQCCDAMVVSHTSRPQEYAELLLSIAAAIRGRSRFPLAAASAMADHPLAGRIRRILKLQEEPMGITRRTLAAMLTIPLVVVAATVYTAVADDKEASSGLESGQPNSVALAGQEENDGSADRLTANVDANKPKPKTPLYSKIYSLPKSEHKQIEEMLAQKRLAAEQDEANRPREVEIPQLQQNIERLGQLIVGAKKELIDLEVFRSLAMQNASNDGLEAMVQKELDKDPALATFTSQLSELRQQLIEQQAKDRDQGSANIKQLSNSRPRLRKCKPTPTNTAPRPKRPFAID